jgi:hypothetical protein
MLSKLLGISENQILPIIIMSEGIFTQKTVKEVINTLKTGFSLPKEKEIFVTIYRAMKESEGLYSRFEIENLSKKNYIKTNENNEVYLPDILFYTYLRKTQKALVASGILKEPKKDLKNYESLTEQQAEQLFVVFSNFMKKLSLEQRKQILEL